ncbi:hypothetical protein FGO68_gene15413 [Halteria grandinella]|uniref:Uncharacterized protein n=1 Tax=Halteria grandinella TaxID=5974 RepID=A0A8J8SWN3_HALGN|nr:hypothetical protein FGO68_gene15413 [Halteria grandinella]
MINQNVQSLSAFITNDLEKVFAILILILNILLIFWISINYRSIIRFYVRVMDPTLLKMHTLIFILTARIYIKQNQCVFKHIVMQLEDASYIYRALILSNPQFSEHYNQVAIFFMTQPQGSLEPNGIIYSKLGLLSFRNSSIIFRS